jgi:hypothetical protein
LVGRYAPLYNSRAFITSGARRVTNTSTFRLGMK